MNWILNESGISLVKSQAKIQPEAQSAGSIQRMVAKLRQGVRNFGVRIIVLLPRNWAYDQVMNVFGCSKHAVKVARKMQDNNDYVVNNEKTTVIRQRFDPEKTKQFIT
ncbi:unnamed protein product [Didymodactylos carnosus]|uniref:Uncharacterized protein n=1 Tax=Didymodactylos carnosus TaxID=1234261 RepID=A0A815NK16_9BILA|nr:unnamed protein product [Didymodactylos carnosus]CAF1511980.1 unnamed protein product [Didymodactylos carnosus]CAF4299687.1 unnamed protein product [Didymodactylos carnosus]CAF4314735.1 unnamed protein product [Didymodactylos carnosus]